MTFRPFFLAAVAALLVGCSLFGGKDNSEPPAELGEFEERVRLREAWSRSTGSGTDERLVRLQPAVVGDRVYVADRNGSVAALDLESGKSIWHTKTGLHISAATGVGSGLVLAGSSEGQLVALDAQTGEQRWLTDVPSEVLSVPQVYEDIVIVQTVDGSVSALSADNAQRLWIYDRSVPVLTLRGTSTPLLVGGAVIAGFANGKMVALEARTGREIWSAAVAVPRGRTELERIVDLDADAAVRDGVLYAGGYQGRLMAISLRDGRTLWNRDMSTFRKIAVDEEQVTVTDADSEVWAIDRRGGRSLWKQGALRRRNLTGPVAVGDYIGVGDFEGYLHLLSVIDGSIAGRTRVDSDGIQATPIAVSGNRLLVLGAGGKLALYRIKPR
jgi:outer membrane protein assembly factor BamB